VCYHFLREKIQRGEVALIYMPTQDMVADALTKNLDAVKITKFRTALMGGGKTA